MENNYTADDPRPFLRSVGATHYRVRASGIVEAYQPGRVCMVAPPTPQRPRWHVLMGYGWRACGDMPEGVEAV